MGSAPPVVLELDGEKGAPTIAIGLELPHFGGDATEPGGDQFEEAGFTGSRLDVGAVTDPGGQASTIEGTADDRSDPEDHLEIRRPRVLEERTDIEAFLEVEAARRPFMEEPGAGGEHRVEPEGTEALQGDRPDGRIHAGVLHAGPHDRGAAAVEEKAPGIGGDCRHGCSFAPLTDSDSVLPRPLPEDRDHPDSHPGPYDGRPARDRASSPSYRNTRRIR